MRFLKVEFKSKKLEKYCCVFSEATKKYGQKTAFKIAQRLQELKSADNVDYLIKYRVGGCHSLLGDRNGQYAMDLIQPYRLVFEIINGQVIIAKILEIVDYH